MRLLACLLALAALAAAEKVELSAFNYHNEIGIPTAKKIKDIEVATLQEERIVGGVVAPINAHPYMAGLIIDLVGITGNSVCSGSLLSANRVLTAAHCWYDGWNQAWQFTVVLGSQYLFFGGDVRVPTSQVVVHPQWAPYTISQDVAIAYLPYNLLFSSSISPVPLPSGTAIWDDFANTWAVAAGYGRTSDQHGLTTSTLVSHVPVQVITNAQCQATYGTTFVIESTLCTNGAGGVGICGGDSGGPLVGVRNGQLVLIGVNSFTAAAGCELGYPSAYARVTSFLDFIYQHL